MHKYKYQIVYNLIFLNSSNIFSVCSEMNISVNLTHARRIEKLSRVTPRRDSNSARAHRGARDASPDGIVNLSGSRRAWHTRLVNAPVSTNRYKNHRFPAEIISHAVCLYFRFCLSYRGVEELLFARGVIVIYEAIRKWCRKFGQAYVNQLRRRRLGRATGCAWMRCSSPSTVNAIISGGR
jgi:hypothetical protein